MWKGSRIDAAQDGWWGGIRGPFVAAPMFRVTSAGLVVQSVRAGAVAAVPAHNYPSTEAFQLALRDIVEGVAASPAPVAPWGVNLVAHASNPRFEADLQAVCEYRCPLVISSVGSPRPIVDAVHAYGGRVWSDVISLEHARKAARAGIDGLVLVCAGAGGNTGWINPFAFLKDVRAFFDGVVAVAGALTDGRQAYAIELLGADLAYVGTPFIATEESDAEDDYKSAVANGAIEDIVLSKAASGIPANLMKESLLRMGLDPADAPALNVGGWTKSAAWSAGHGIGGVKARRTCAALVEQLLGEYEAARALPR